MGKKKKKTNAEPTFEERLEKLEQIVQQVESGELPLEEALKGSEEGAKCYRECDRVLKAAEKKVDILLRNSEGDLEAQPFEEAPTHRDDPSDDEDDDDAEAEDGDGSLF